MRTLLAVLSLTLLAAPAFADQEAADQPRGWEYRELHRSQIAKLAAGGSKNSFADGLNKLGADGWEVIGFEPATSGRDPAYLLKRPARSKSAVGPGAEPRIVTLKFARASELAKVLTAVFQRKRGEITVVADDRSNALIISADDGLAREALAIVSELDREVADPEPPKKR